MSNLKLSKALTWDQLADAYDRVHSQRKARTLPLDVVFNWAENQKDDFKFNNKEQTIHRILK